MYAHAGVAVGETVGPVAGCSGPLGL
jgi:hypothetical protein